MTFDLLINVKIIEQYSLAYEEKSIVNHHCISFERIKPNEIRNNSLII
jgi:hypothetical protein